MTMDSLIKQTKIYCLGILAVVLIILFIVLSLPLYLYRWILTKFIAPLIGGNLRKAVNISSQGFAAEFLKPPNTPTRFCVCIPVIVEAHIPVSLIYDEINTKIFNSEDTQGNLKYPEIKQYIESWMGIMFWKEDTKFSLSNHIKVHKLGENGTYLESEKFFMELGEKLLNEPFPRKRSPWELHIVHNFKNPRTSENTSGTLVFFRYHHAMGDGSSVANLFRDGFLKLKSHPLEVKHEKGRKLEYGLSWILMFIKGAIYESGRFAYLHLLKKTRYHVPDDKKKWHQYFGRAPSIPVSKIKFIKNTFGVSFTSVLISSFTTALRNMLVKLEKESNISEDELPETFLLGIPLPKRDHPKHFSNHFTLGIFETTLTKGYNAIARLQECELRMGKLGKSAAPKLFPLFVRIFSSHLAIVAHLSMKNRILGAILTSFSAASLEPTWNGHKCHLLDAPCGALEGVGGLVCSAFSFGDMLQLSVTAEAGVMTRENLNELLVQMYTEIENLHEMAIKFGGREENGNHK